MEIALEELEARQHYRDQISELRHDEATGPGRVEASELKT